MCGIAGLYSLSASPDRQAMHRTVATMTNALHHRGPDEGDIWQDPETPVALGHRRLSIIDLSSAGRQPMRSSSERYIIVFNGEIYNFRQLRAELERLGAFFRGYSDTEVILAALEEWGFDYTLKAMRGMFAFALWDRQTGRLYFARDRMGKKPLYIGWSGASLIFASELKALTTHPEFRRTIDRPALTAYMRFGYIPSPLCIYEKIWSLPPGHALALDLKHVELDEPLDPYMKTYWSHLDALQTSRAAGCGEKLHIPDRFEDLLQDCVAERLISDVPLGAFLSGGIDSSLTVALMQKASSTPVKTYSIGFHEKGYNEAVHAKKVAAYLGTDHHEQYIEPSHALDLIPKLSRIYDEPFADISAIPTYLVSYFARQSVTVALSGDGGDEMLGGYTRHVQGPKVWKNMKRVPKALRGLFTSGFSKISVETWDRISQYHPQFGSHIHKVSGALSEEDPTAFYLRLVSQWDRPDRVVNGGGEPMIPLTNPELQPEGLSFGELMMYWDVLSYLPGDILTKVDRASMAVSLEVRAPLLDQRIYEYVWSLPEAYKIHQGQGKWLLRHVLQKHVPERLFKRPKQGFNIPIAQWLRGPLRDWAENLLDEKTMVAQGLIDPAPVRKIWNDHCEGRGNHSGKLWTVLMFQDWYARWMAA
ncbi:MAG: asparagine synthase (glutamine-hydrolyzing) [Alphaproteobacteria bacterium]|nr:asparagine synthase (glutamine-hydrolyzing) [Alphaproteobacteria bacterium]